MQNELDYHCNSGITMSQHLSQRRHKFGPLEESHILHSKSKEFDHHMHQETIYNYGVQITLLLLMYMYQLKGICGPEQAE
jgi:hypothetical protein